MTDLPPVLQESRVRIWPWYVLAIGLIALDQITKALVRAHFHLYDSILILGPDLLRFTYVLNPGIAFGVRSFGLPLLIVFNGLAAAALSFYLAQLVKKRDPLRWPIVLFLAGAVGNGIDRALFGRVTDFIDCDFPDFIMERWPVFNVADSCVTVGITLLCLLILFGFGRHKVPALISSPPAEPHDRIPPSEPPLPTDHGNGPAAGTH